jgi:hypothetical protein
MWQTITFETIEQANKWREANERTNQIEQIFINNGYGFEYRKLKQIGARKWNTHTQKAKSY